MEAGGKDCEEETLQTAFKKLRVDAESLPGAVSVSEVLAPRAVSRACPDSSGAKSKLSCPKDNWHGSMRKTSRGASRTQRRRRSKSPILHPPKFTYCSSTTASALSSPSGCLKHQRLAVPEPVEPCPGVDGRTVSTVAVPGQKELSPSDRTCHITPLVFGSTVEYDTSIGAGVLVSLPTSQEIPAVIATAAAATSCPDVGSSAAGLLITENVPEKSACDRADAGAGAPQRPGPSKAADFQALSKLHSNGSPAEPGAACSCVRRNASDSMEAQGAESQCLCQSQSLGWDKVEVYSFTGLRNVITECERSLPIHEDTGQGAGPRAPNTAATNAATTTSPSSPSPSLTSGSPRSCSEQARAYVDDITIEDLSGYMEYYLYIPKKMSHMAEMMYT
ncbi:oxidative stress-responsive serine-rich protein 1 [Genypterus blacodes]|uniref:oxidative stress-responsive serine-rich protein 1 n=1 Tax=Genypterus blacodes TaxID=154954 RepID=UPI003F762C9C